MLRITLSIVLIFFATNFFLFTENEMDTNRYINNLFSTSSKIQVNAKISGNLENEEQVIAKSEYPLQGYGISTDGAVTMDDKYFGFLFYDIEKNPRQYAAQKVVITGFVYKEPGFQQNELKVVRIQMPKCGSEEEQILGLMCIVENASDFKNDEWVVVKGTLIVKSYVDSKTKLERYKYYIEPESIEKIQKNANLTI
ncbi:MAG: hypothetical protein WBJ13_08245 [Sedimentibacter sp.]